MSGEISLTEFLPTLHRTLSARHSRTLSKNDSAESEGSHFNGRPALPGFVILISSDGQSSSRVYGTPADRAGLTAGDEIIEVNGTPIEGKDHNEIVNIIHRVR
ncbi:hypothetical protein AB6A40_008428 [Gnathostoma spinigerum]|uniref:PDZ domain-containing protein n=1 Tax=Gnathostoma spinigerum TaxID=75299 RepID=A0ABD6EP20_9BILA